MEYFSQKVSKNLHSDAFILKANIRHYFEEVNHKTLILILERKIKDYRIIWLIRKILSNHSSNQGMPLGNLTSQFLANVYLNELDQFVKRELKIKYYLRYVDDFAILDSSKIKLQFYQQAINLFLNKELGLLLHPHKTSIRSIKQGVTFLGAGIFPYYHLLKKGNAQRIRDKIFNYKKELILKIVDYDVVYATFEGWIAYACHSHTYNLRQKTIELYERTFPWEISSIEINRLQN